MHPERWKQIDDLLLSALDRRPEERDLFLRDACGGDQALEREIRSLLESEERAGRFLENPAMEVAAKAIALEGSHETPATSDSLIGQTLSHYRVVEKLRDGGMGVVWKARDTRLNRFVALKFLPAARMSDPERKRRFIQEARAASALSHPNIVTIYDIGQAGIEGRPADFIAMEFVPGKALDQLITRKGLRLKEALRYAIDVADALAAAHAAGIVHRDLKPGNVMVNESGCAKVLDFGLAKLTEPGGAEYALTVTAEIPKTDEGIIVGTVSYMSPEQAEGKKVDTRSDIFSFGAVLYEMLTGRRAFPGDSMASILSAILYAEPKLSAETGQTFPRELDRIVTRCLQKDPDRRYQHAGDLKIDLLQVKEEHASGEIAKEPRARARTGRRWRILALGASIAVLCAVGWWFLRPKAEPTPWNLTRLTTDPGYSSFPALSPDGRLLAYSSDQGSDSGEDLFVKQVSGGPPIRLTSDGEGNTTPDFSPDGTKIVFRSNRDGGGIYEIPAFGGEVRFVARDGLNPKFSPDGSQVAYWVGDPGVHLAVPGTGDVFVVPAAGGAPQRIGANFTTARRPIWSRDGKRLLMIGYTSAKQVDDGLDWWLVAVNGDGAVKTGVNERLAHDRLRLRQPAGNIMSAIPYLPAPASWSAEDDTVIFSMIFGETENLWEIGVSPITGKVTGEFRRLTTGAGNEQYPSRSLGNSLAFTKIETRTDVWSLPVDLDRGRSRGSVERITESPAYRYSVSLSGNGRYIAFSSNQAGPINIWMRDLESGKESSVAASPNVQRYPVISTSGARVAYGAYEKDKRVMYASVTGGAPEKLCERCVRATDWSRDDKTLLWLGGSPYRIYAMDVASHRQTTILKHPKYDLLYGRFSPDNRWVSFTVRTGASRAHIAIAPLGVSRTDPSSSDEFKTIPESAWIHIADVGLEDWADWSPDGRTLYFTSRKDGHHCLWGQPIDPASHRPLGEPFALLHLHGRVHYGDAGWSAAGGRIAMVLSEDKGNIWMMSRSGAH